MTRDTRTHEILGAALREGGRLMSRSSGQPPRLAAAASSIAATPLAFIFDGKRYGGFAGDTLASALLANGVRLVGRSFKYHRPRGILTAGSGGAERAGRAAHRRAARAEHAATSVELYDGLEAASQNRWPSLAFDVGAVNSLFSPLFVAGFYYKTFMWPAAFWEKLYEPVIRRAAGLGRASGEARSGHLREGATRSAMCW